MSQNSILELRLTAEHKSVSYKWISQELSVSANSAKRILSEFVSKNPELVEVRYVLSGKLKNGGQHSIRQVYRHKLEEEKSKFIQIFSIHIYSIEPKIASKQAEKSDAIAPISSGKMEVKEDNNPDSSTRKNGVLLESDLVLWNLDLEKQEVFFREDDILKDNPLRDGRFSAIKNLSVQRISPRSTVSAMPIVEKPTKRVKKPASKPVKPSKDAAMQNQSSSSSSSSSETLKPNKKSTAKKSTNAKQNIFTKRKSAQLSRSNSSLSSSTNSIPKLDKKSVSASSIASKSSSKSSSKSPKPKKQKKSIGIAQMFANAAKRPKISKLKKIIEKVEATKSAVEATKLSSSSSDSSAENDSDNENYNENGQSKTSSAPKSTKAKSVRKRKYAPKKSKKKPTKKAVVKPKPKAPKVVPSKPFRLYESDESDSDSDSTEEMSLSDPMPDGNFSDAEDNKVEKPPVPAAAVDEANSSDEESPRTLRTRKRRKRTIESDDEEEHFSESDDSETERLKKRKKNFFGPRTVMTSGPSATLKRMKKVTRTYEENGYFVTEDVLVEVSGDELQRESAPTSSKTSKSLEKEDLPKPQKKKSKQIGIAQFFK